MHDLNKLSDRMVEDDKESSLFTEVPKRFSLSRRTPVGGDCTCGYNVTFDGEYTVGEFLEEVLCKRSKEWGYIVVLSNQHQKETDYCSYSLGELTEDLHNANLKDSKITSATASGGYSRMDFTLYIDV